MRDLLRSLGLTVIDNLAETIGWVKGEKAFYVALCLISQFGNARVGDLDAAEDEILQRNSTIFP